MEENKKYHLDENDIKKIDVKGKTYTLYRVIADCKIKNLYGIITKGQKGGYIFPGTLSTADISWVGEGSLVGPNCFVCDGAYVESSTLLHDVTVAGVACVQNSTINPSSESNIKGEAMVVDSEIYGDLDMFDQTKFANSTLNGRLQLNDEVSLQFCDVNTGKGKVSARGANTYYNQEIVGSGRLGVANSVKISNKKQLAKA